MPCKATCGRSKDLTGYRSINARERFVGREGYDALQVTPNTLAASAGELFGAARGSVG
jgi:hypothetical protein